MRLLVLMLSLFVVFSCKTRQVEDELNYVQNLEDLATEASIQHSAGTLQVGDQLEVFISARDMDVVKPFNRQYSSSQHISSSISGGTSSVSSVQGPVTYIVDDNGDVEFNVIGKLNTTGKTLSEFKEELRSRLTRYVKDPTVNMKLTNFKITVLGEVNNRGELIMPNGKANILNAIAMAGDISVYGVKDDIIVIRTENGNVSHGSIDLTDANLINSPYFNLKQGDAIIVKSNEKKQKIARQNPNLGTTLTIAGLALSALVVAITLVK